MIKYLYLRHLDLIEAHQDYHEKFLFDTKTSLPDNLYVAMDYQFARKVTRNFRRNSTRSDCAKISRVSFYRKLPYPEHMKDYFSCAKILCLMSLIVERRKSREKRIDLSWTFRAHHFASRWENELKRLISSVVYDSSLNIVLFLLSHRE